MIEVRKNNAPIMTPGQREAGDAMSAKLGSKLNLSPAFLAGAERAKQAAADRRAAKEQSTKTEKPVNAVTPAQLDIATVDQQIELHAKDYDLVDQIQRMRKGEILARIRELFRYKRDDGGFDGFVTERLKLPRSTAYEHIAIYEGLGESVRNFGQISHAATFQTATAAPDVKAIIAERVAAGEVFTAAQVKDLKKQAAEQAIADLQSSAENARAELEAAHRELAHSAQKTAAEKAALEGQIRDLTSRVGAFEKQVEEFRTSRPKPEKAKEQAAEQGGVVLGSDGKFHSGSSVEQKRMVDAFMFVFDRALDLTDNPPAPERVVAGCAVSDRNLLRDRCDGAIAYLGKIRSQVDAE